MGVPVLAGLEGAQAQTASSSDTVIIVTTILGALQLIMTVLQTVVMEYLRRRYPSPSQFPPQSTSTKKAAMWPLVSDLPLPPRAPTIVSAQPPPLIRRRTSDDGEK